jgi:thiamine transport system substrate-binding protein
MKMKPLSILCLLTLLFSLTAHADATEPAELVVMSHDSFNISEELVTAFEQANNAKLRFLKAGDTGAALNKAILSKNNPLADLFYGVDNTFLSRALAADIFLPYSSPKLADIPKALQLDPQHRLLPVDFGDVCLNYDKAWFEKNKLAPPKGLEDLTQPKYKGLTVVENPATSSPGLAFLLATVGHLAIPATRRIGNSCGPTTSWSPTVGRAPTGASSAPPPRASAPSW